MIYPKTFVDTPSAKIPGAPLCWDLNFRLPSHCPSCEQLIEPRITAFSYLNLTANGQFGTLLLKCNECRIYYIACYHIDASKRLCEFVSVYPDHELIEIQTDILLLSPRFVELYRQSLGAEAQGSNELCRIGLDSALDALVRDYAIKALKKKPGKVMEKDLDDALKKYLPKLERRVSERERVDAAMLLISAKLSQEKKRKKG